MEHLSKKKLDKVCERIWQVHGSLKGLGGLFTQGTRDICFDDSEFFGIGQLLKTLGEELEVLEDVLMCGEDSTLKSRYGAEEERKESLTIIVILNNLCKISWLTKNRLK
jgi:hypothetical protein